MTINPFEILKMIKQGQNPQQLMIDFLSQSVGDNPVFQNILTLAKEGKTQEIEQIVRNIFQSQGLDFDKEFNSFRKSLKL